MVTNGRAVVDTLLEDHDVKAPPSPRVDDQNGRSSPHPFIARIPLTGSFLLPLLIALLLFLLLGTAPSPVVALFLIHLPLVGGGLIDVWPARIARRGRMFIRQGSHYRWGVCRREACRS